MPARYHFVTTIDLDAEPKVVWDVLADSENWPTWWKWLDDAELLAEGDEDGLGRTVRNRVTSPAGYRLGYVGTATRVIEPELLEFVSIGELEGTGVFQLSPNGEGSHLVFTWLVETPKWWMNLLAPIAGPVFSWNHDQLMTDFAWGLANETGGMLVGVDNHQLDPDEEGFFNLPA